MLVKVDYMNLPERVPSKGMGHFLDSSYTVPSFYLYISIFQQVNVLSTLECATMGSYIYIT